MRNDKVISNVYNQIASDVWRYQ